MTDEQIMRLRELEAKATKGPWTAKEPAFAPGIKARVFGPTYKGKFEGQETMAVPDADLIAETRNALPELLDEVERLRARVAALEKVREAAEVYLTAEQREVPENASMDQINKHCDEVEQYASALRSALAAALEGK